MNPGRLQPVLILFPSLLMFLSCSTGSADFFDPANTEYLIDITASGRADLKDGFYEESAAPGSASIIRIRLENPRAFGDVDGDGSVDAVLVLLAEGGGSGTFTYLAAVLNRAGGPRVPDALFLGDRIRVESLEIGNQLIRLTILDRRPDESLSDPPTVRKSLYFRLAGGKLTRQ